jgi:hypothetical protein
MNQTTPSWIQSGRGTEPEQRWSINLKSPLTALRLARESGDVLAADEAGELSRIDPTGQLVKRTHGFRNLKRLAWSDTGNRGAAVVSESKLCCFDDQLQIDWTIELPEAITAIDMDPHGNHIGVAMANHRNVIYDINRRQVCEFETAKPLRFWEFLATEPVLVAAAEQGILCKYSFEGEEIWRTDQLANVGDMKVAGDGETVFVSARNQRIRTFHASGKPGGTFMIEGRAHKLACSFLGDRLLVTTLEGHLYWFDEAGEFIWGAVLPDEIEQVGCAPMGDGLFCGFRSGHLVCLAWD